MACAQNESNTPVAQFGCNSTCGDVQIPFPFGMNELGCYADHWFQIECRNHTPYLKSIGLEVSSIDASEGTIDIMHPIHRWNCKVGHNATQEFVDLRGSPFVYSQVSNVFISVGCNEVSFLLSNGTQVSGCVSICDDKNEVEKEIEIDNCNGKYCCVTSLPLYLSEFNVTTESLGNNNDDCSYALIVQYHRVPDYMRGLGINYRRSWNSLTDLGGLKNVVVVLEWEIHNSSIRLPSSGAGYCVNTNITSSRNTHSGRKCYCDTDPHGNPYIQGGCTNDYGYDGGQGNKNRSKWAIIGVFSSLGSIILLLGSWRVFKVVRRRIIKNRKEKNFKKNGGLLLEKRLSSGEVNVDKVKHFSLKELEKATDSFNMNRVLGKGGQGTVYKGMLIDGKIVAVKKFRVQGNVEEFINEFVILSQINHRNVVKLLGCCLEKEIPLLVYEFIPNGNLYEYLHDQNEDLPMTWDMRLRIATEIAGALFYLHSAASQPIYHRDVKSTNILLDEKYRAKVADFGASRMISIEDTHLTTVVQGTFGYLDPEYFHTSQLTEKSDVYSFGVVLLELLTGQKPLSSLRPNEAKSLASYFVLCVEEDRLFDIIDDRVIKEGDKEHIIAVANLAYSCLELNGKRRPTMKEVTRELDEIWKLERKSNNAQQNHHEEIEHPAIEYQHPWVADSASDISPSNLTFTSESEIMHILTE
ncbi:hypothetical protein PIB30_021264 [Stylosanthes scabra]|uniref:Protein kinase domain-containing protein n=1 Tax=Stylosanthes scabra TaxID=79078 RepID=A0ABU6X701_9FABA|nr:hypothetical protein [Stylosanthes scabra]